MRLPLRSATFSTFTLVLFGLFNVSHANPLTQTTLSGFMSTSVTTSNNETPLFQDHQITDRVNFRADSVLGVQIDSIIDEKTRFSSQLIARDSADQFDLNAEWLYIARTIGSHLELRAGRLRTPIYLYSDTIYVGVTYPWVRTPEEVYNLFANITRYSGLDLSYDIEIGNTNNNLRFFVGAIKENIEVGPININFESNEMYGFEATSSTLNNHARVMLMQLRVPSFIVGIDIGKAQVISVADRFSLNNIELITEYAYRRIPQDAGSLTSWGWYGTIAYTKNDYTPYITLALRDSAKSILNITRDANSVTVGTKYHLNPNVATKCELQYVQAKQGSQGVFTVIPDHNNAVLATVAITARF